MGGGNQKKKTLPVTPRGIAATVAHVFHIHLPLQFVERTVRRSLGPGRRIRWLPITHTCHTFTQVSFDTSVGLFWLPIAH